MVGHCCLTPAMAWSTKTLLDDSTLQLYSSTFSVVKSCQLPLFGHVAWMRWLTPIEFCSSNHWITGEDPREDTLHVDPKSLQWPVLIWHGAARSQGGSSEPTFLADVNEAQCYAPTVVHADTGLQVYSLFCFFSGVTMTIDSSEDGSADNDDDEVVDAAAGPRNTRNECSDIFNEHFISLRVDFSTFSTASSVRGATVQYSTWRSSASGVDSSLVTGTAELFKWKTNTNYFIKLLWQQPTFAQ